MFPALIRLCPQLSPATEPAQRKSTLAAVASTALFAALAWAAPAARADVMQVKPGDTFSALAARQGAKLSEWRKYYDAKLSGLRDPNRITPGMTFELVQAGDGRSYLKLVGSAPAPVPVAKAAPRIEPAAPVTPVVPPPPTELVLGVLPNIAVSQLVIQYDSVRSYLERQTGRKVRVVVPANFKAFYDGMTRGDFDVSVAGSHLARLAQVDAQLVPLAIYEPRIPAQFIGPAEGPAISPKDTRGKVIAFANPTSLVAMYGQQWLRQQGLEPGKDYEVRGARTDMGVGRALLSGDAVAAIMSFGEFRSLPPEESSRLRIIEVFARVPNFIVMGHPRLGKDLLAKLQAAWLAMPADKDDGAAFVKAAGLSGIVAVDDAVLRELDPFVAITRRAMSGGN